MDKKIAIGILGTRGIPAQYGGFETFAEHLSIGLSKRGHEVYVYCPKYQSFQEPNYHGAKLVFIANFEHHFKNRVPRAISNLLYDIVSLIHACVNTEITHIYMLGYSAGPFLVLPRLFGKKLITNPDGLEWKSTRWGPIARSWLYICEYLSAKLSNQLVGDAHPITDRFSKLYNARISTIEYGTELFSDDGCNLEYPKDSYYLAVARMVPETKIDTIIDGFNQANPHNKKLVIVGPVADKNFFESNILPRIEKGNTEYLGAIYDRVRLNKLRANAMALIHGHASDGTNPSLLESMGCASPVLSIDRESNAKVLTRENALFFDDKDSLADVIRSFELMPLDQRRRMGEKNMVRVKLHFSWEATVIAHEKIFCDN